ncbi:MAG: hypothetical protein HOP33_16885, partial [Verrucomicrobia bacterium]|nr:hypothetical protein [Verrucomicrobiota bacterium]
RGDRAARVFEAIAERCEKAHPSMILGVGSIVDAPTAALYISALLVGAIAIFRQRDFK